MLILSFKPGHDGHIACIENGILQYSYEAEKDSRPRYSPIDVETIIDSLSVANGIPDAIALSGWATGVDPRSAPVGAGYLGTAPPRQSKLRFLGQQIELITASHERSHVMCAYGLSPFPQGQPCYALVWEGHIGAFYRIDEHAQIRKLCDVMSDPGIRYAFAYGVADPSFALRRGQVRLGDAGKLMALAAFGEDRARTNIENDFLNAILSPHSAIDSLEKSSFESSPYFNIGVESSEFKQLAKQLSDAIFEKFIDRIRPFVLDDAPLLISGGCGLNCDWNRNWLDCGLFSDVFVPPCPNDVGAAIGTAIDAQHYLTGEAKIQWDVYSGQPFLDDIKNIEGFDLFEMEVRRVADLLHQGAILGWAQGRAEIGPRALGNRSILAAPFSKHTLDRLNDIKRREKFRPIAPICLEEKSGSYFDLGRPSPHMLYFSQVKDKKLQAITHVDGSSRPQTVNSKQNPEIHSLLKAFENVSGYGVLCNTSLNFNGTGFINRTSDLARYASENKLDGFVANKKLYLRKQRPQAA
ncbi:carbamoyltransferase C-terminal domain-containing protein [Ralstonia flaminis]|jgi:hydroxymethyl cephem carbamoyltransferase|uniref:Proline dehydrogenase n=1 Tax=Ralstonia flaminis TaxID=3058597 RepID=A0ABM9K8W8_9RALS|nr:carbamoyltransferase C-terminal domain-containing protein [Ralstonia sp. LMG 18101]CAJ0819886.1 hypothetical protein LMG18101_04095 [Ralstonia sp. LMG 18101]